MQTLILDRVRAAGAAGKSVLDIGCGVGVLHLTLMREGAASAVGVDLSEGMLGHAKSFADRFGVGDRVRYVLGDAVDRAAELPVSDVTVMDKVVCCYEDLPALLRTAAGRTRGTLILSHPRDHWLMRWSFKATIALARFGRGFAPFWYDWPVVPRLLEAHGFRLVGGGHTLLWEVLEFQSAGR